MIPEIPWKSAFTELRMLGPVALVTLDRPPVNALSHAFRAQISEALARAAASGATGLVLTGSHGIFVAGADITELGGIDQPSLRDLIGQLEALPIPTVAAIDGAALGGGLELALGCRVRLASPRARLGFPEVGLGLLPGAGGTVRSTLLCGAEVALELVASGRTISASEALSLRLLDRVVAGDLIAASVAALEDPALQPSFARPVSARARLAFDPAAFDQAATILLQKTKGEAAGRCIEAVRSAATLPFAEAMQRERARFVEALATPESRALRHLFFAERQAAKVDGLDHGLARPLQTIGVVGAGTMGRGIAMACADAGLQVRLCDLSPTALSATIGSIQTQYKATAQKGRLSDEQAAARIALLSPVPDLAGLAGCDLVIEAAFEDLSVKLALFADLDATLGPEVILATNTSYLDVNQIAAAVRRPQRVLGLHFFSPANIMKLLEIVRASATDATTLASGIALSRQLRKISVVVGVCRGFVGNRMLQARNAPLSSLLLEGASPTGIDAAFRGFGWPMGPFEMQDMAGLDISWRNRRALGTPDALPDALCEAGRLGQKTGKGWYRYQPNGRMPIPDPEVADLIAALATKHAIKRRDIQAAEIIARTHGPLVAEGRQILAEGIAARASDIDVVWVNGYGFPRHLGGPMFWADTAPPALTQT